MRRKNLLEANLTEGQNVATVVTGVLAKDGKFLRKEKRNLEDSLEEAEEKLEERLTSNAPLDKSTVEVLFSNILDIEAKIKLYQKFESTFLGE
jgi:hypothetical protein